MSLVVYNPFGKISSPSLHSQSSSVSTLKPVGDRASNVFADMVNNLTDMAAKSEEASLKTALGSGNYIESLNYVQQLELSTKALSATSETFINAYNNVLNILK